MTSFAMLPRRCYPLPESFTYKDGRWIENWFSNFGQLSAPITVAGLTITSNLETAFVALKVTDQALRRRIVAVGNQAQPGVIKRIGKARGWVPELRAEFRLRGDHDDVCLAAMWQLITHKWAAGREEAQRLLAATPPFVEWTNWGSGGGDRRWGVAASDGEGCNALGLLLDLQYARLQQGKGQPMEVPESAWGALQSKLIGVLRGMHPETLLRPTVDGDRLPGVSAKVATPPPSDPLAGMDLSPQALAFAKDLKAFDWYHAYADDNRVHERGLKAEQGLKQRFVNLVRSGEMTIDAAEELWDRLAPNGYVRPCRWLDDVRPAVMAP